MKRASVPAILALSAISCRASAQPGNNNCTSPMPITAFGTFSFTTVDATTDGLPHAGCDIYGSTQMYDDVWFCWTPAHPGLARLRACSNMMFDTAFAVYDGCAPCPEAAGLIACDDQGCNLQHSIVWNVVPGHTYLIRIGGFTEGSFGAGSLTIGLPAIVAGPIVNPNNNHTYYLTEPQSWSSAQLLAASYGGTLAVIRNQDENDWLRATLGFADETFRHFWIGLSDTQAPGTFQWVNGEPLTYTNWAAGQPDNFTGNEHVVEFDGSTGLWSDDDSDNPSNVTFGTIDIAPPPPACRCDWNQDLNLNTQDFFDFLTDLFKNNADYNNSGNTNSQDFFDFLACFFVGC